VNLRSKPPVEGLDRADVDVAAIARKFGGGGHRRAAGARTRGTLPEVRQRLLSELMQTLDG
jgi:phosphoesterase RecJ-like protein